MLSRKCLLSYQKLHDYRPWYRWVNQNKETAGGQEPLERRRNRGRESSLNSHWRPELGLLPSAGRVNALITGAEFRITTGGYEWVGGSSKKD